jgi:L-alanine-DL-glutamate epimerase-like enolase superfamily enzyme
MRRRPQPRRRSRFTAEVRGHGYQVHVRIYTGQGIIGPGETTDASKGNAPIIQGFGRQLIGRDRDDGYGARLRGDPQLPGG